MKRFIALYLLFLALLFVLFYAQTSMVSTYLNDGQTYITLYVLDMFLLPSQLNGIDIWINPNYKIIITQACNGMIPILFLFASILAYSAKILDKIIWMSIGYILFSMMNVLRILLVVYITENGRGQEDFYWSHDLLGNMMLMFTGLALFIVFIKRTSRLKRLNLKMPK